MWRRDSPSLFAEDNAQMVLFIGMPAQLFNTFNHAVPALLCAVLILTLSLIHISACPTP